MFTREAAISELRHFCPVAYWPTSGFLGSNKLMCLKIPGMSLACPLQTLQVSDFWSFSIHVYSWDYLFSPCSISIDLRIIGFQVDGPEIPGMSSACHSLESCKCQKFTIIHHTHLLGGYLRTTECCKQTECWLPIHFIRRAASRQKITLYVYYEDHFLVFYLLFVFHIT
jgi:hypothetical protein